MMSFLWKILYWLDKLEICFLLLFFVPLLFLIKLLEQRMRRKSISMEKHLHSREVVSDSRNGKKFAHLERSQYYG